MTVSRVPPHDMGAERDALGAILLDREAWLTAREFLAADGSQFYSDLHGRVWRAAVSADAAGEPVDTITVTARLKSHEEQDALLELTGAIPRVDAIEARCRRIRELATVRAVMTRAHELCAMAYAGVDDPTEWLDLAETALGEAAEGRCDEGDFVHVHEIAVASLRRVTERAETGGGIQGAKCGLHDLDRVLKGFGPGQLIVVAARPGIGKSAFAKDVALGICRDAGKPGLFASMEMPREEIGDRIVVGESAIDHERYQLAQLQPIEMRKAIESVKRLEGVPLHFCDKPGIGVDFLARSARKLKRRHGDLACIVADYLQLFKQALRKFGSREEAVAHNSRMLKMLALELKCPVIALSQLNRAVEQRPNKRPMVSDIRESGAVEQDADKVLLLYRDQVYHPDTEDKNVLEVNVGKHRGGQTGVVRVRWVGPSMKVVNLEHRHDHQPQQYEDA